MNDYDLSNEGIILVLGVTGAGKSYFLNQLKKHSTQEGHGLHSQTTRCQAVRIFLDDEDKRSITVVDTPGFDDTTRSRGEILAEITEYLAAQHALRVPLRGVLYLHKITDNRMTGSSLTYLRLLQSLVGDDALQNVVLVTNMWNKLRDEDVGQAYKREQDLIDNYWGPMADKGSYVTQFDGSADAAYALVYQLAGKPSVVLDVQKQIMDEDRSLLGTTAGATLVHQLEEDTEACLARTVELDSLLERELNSPVQNRERIRMLQDEKAQVENTAHLVEESVDRMEERQGPRIRERVKEAMKSGGREAIVVLAAVLNLTVFVVQLGLGGG
ncbi:hypothetical protein FDECE_10371 [Fusarium decemcellulare]|nr:hypothetical protein FDECE_10371 [Fusarium decemcellulare]